MNLQEKSLTRDYKVRGWTSRHFFMNQLDTSWNMLRAIKSRLLYKPTAVCSGTTISKFKMALFNYYSSSQGIITWNRNIEEIKTDVHLLIYDVIENLQYTRHCTRRQEVKITKQSTCSKKVHSLIENTIN